jgi:hypothetical protein
MSRQANQASVGALAVVTPGYLDGLKIYNILKIILVILLITLIAALFYQIKRQIYYICVKGENGKQKVYQVSKKRIFIGREKGCDVHLNNSQISRKHLWIEFGEKGIKFKDQNSSNGTFVNKKQLFQGFVPYGQEILIGDFHLKFKKG